MEFGIIVQSYLPKFWREGKPNAEHEVLFRDLETTIAADKAGFKYIWATEHHFLDEYSHLSANDVFLAYLAHATDYIHLGSGIFNPLPQVNHPAKVAEKVAMLDHLSGGRFEFGTGRGAGTHEILGFLPEMRDLTHTREVWEDVIGEFAKMWTQDEYEGYQGKYWSLPPRKILPKPWKKPHPAMWYACGNTASYEMAGRRGLGVLGFSVGTLAELDPVLKAYKNAIPNAEPVGTFVNDNIMVVGGAYIAETTEQARKSFMDAAHAYNYLTGNVYRYHDTFPHPEGVPYWPELLPDPTEEAIDFGIEAGLVCGDPDHAIRQFQRWEAAGVDQVCLAFGSASMEDTLETIRMMGEYVIPKIDKDRVHSTTRYRDAAVAKGAKR
jgi:alkanesulfonate monooxygenase SsuD/methylene tetrahydromethanopterin reductase-like flavin-dependent oxidoreductase (luciferase family)